MRGKAFVLVPTIYKGDLKGRQYYYICSNLIRQMEAIMSNKIMSFAIAPGDYLGNSVKVFLNDRSSDKAAFDFKVTGFQLNVGKGKQTTWSWVGYDNERLNLRIDSEDIDFILEK